MVPYFQDVQTSDTICLEDRCGKQCGIHVPIEEPLVFKHLLQFNPEYVRKAWKIGSISQCGFRNVNCAIMMLVMCK